MVVEARQGLSVLEQRHSKLLEGLPGRRDGLLLRVLDLEAGLLLRAGWGTGRKARGSGPLERAG